MKKIIFIIFLLCFQLAKAQDVQMAYDYFRKGEYQKSATVYEKLYKKNNNNRSYLKQLVRCYQQLENFSKAESLLKAQHLKFKKNYYLLVELGYNYQLQKINEKATPLYVEAIKAIDISPSSARNTGKAFQDNGLLDYALDAYKKAMKLNPKSNFNLYIATIYGEKGAYENMYSAYLDMAVSNPKYATTIQRYLSKFITDDSENQNNILFRNLLIKRLQNKPNIALTKLLAWTFMQQKDYHKALAQEKAIYLRSSNNLTRLFELGAVCTDEKKYQTAKKTYDFIIHNTNNQNDIISAQLEMLKIGITTAKTEEDFSNVEHRFEELFTKYGKGRNTVNLQIAYSDFLVFTKNQPNDAINILKNALTVASSRYVKGDIKIKLADIMVYSNKFNQALINYTQVQTDLRGSDVAQKARLKVAKTSYYKGDFDWAKIQLKVLKSATSKLISNDALALNLLVGDNIAGDTIRLALKKYATADLLAYQNKTQQAIDTLQAVLTDFKGHAIEDEALFKQAELYKKINQFEFAEDNYQKIIQLKKDGILADNAYFELGALYENELQDIEKAKEMYQKIIFDFANSIYLVDARKRFRKLRGDVVK
ncbi:MAG: tetratricopeptide repeat protein [Flavobacteriaceae bacterium]